MNMTVTVKYNSKDVIARLELGKKRGLEAIGSHVAGYAMENLSQVVYVEDPDRTWKLTGRLRNSITYALSGSEAHMKTYTDDDGTTAYEYQGTAPNDTQTAVYVGTNVIYAAVI